jgi:hypothetical protein
LEDVLVNLEIVSHCWHYSPHLTYQLSSLVLFSPSETQVTMTVYYNEDDTDTIAVRDFFDHIEIDNVTWSWRQLPKEHLFRRSIGRNHAALETKADWIWFADADMCFRDRCLDTLASIAKETQAELLYPRFIRITQLRDVGDRLLEAVADHPRLVDLAPEEFVPLRYRRAIGGAQIVRGDTARRLGYNRDSRRCQRPRTRWDRTRDDVRFRRSLEKPGVPIELPELYRIRHGTFGRKDEFGKRVSQ